MVALVPKNCGAFVPRMPGEVLLGHFFKEVHSPSTNPLHHRAPQAARGTEGGRSERGEGGGGQAEDKEEDRG